MIRGGAKSRRPTVGDQQPTADDLSKVVEEELPVIAELIGDETQKVDLTIDDMISKAVSQQAEESMNLVKEEMVNLRKMIVTPPYDPLKLALMLEINTRLMRSCHLRARNTVGLGWMVRPVSRDEDEKEVDEKQYKAQKKKLKALYDNPNPITAAPFLPETLATPLDFSEIMNRMKIDEEATGNGYLEITRNNAGKIDGIYNIPSHTIRVLRLGGYIQVRGRWSGSDIAFHGDPKIRRRYFKRFGDARVISRLTGQETAGLKPQERANELLPFHIYSSRSSWYGIPRWISAVAAIQGSRLASVRNMAFFENDAVGRMAIVVSGGALTAQSVQDIRTFVNREGKGVEKSHRVMVLQAEPRRVISSKGVGTRIDVVPLTVGVNEDASFLGYRGANDEEVREASGLSSPFFTAQGINRASANVLRKITIEQDLIPDLRSHQHVINRTVSFDLLTSTMTDRERENFIMEAELRFREPASVDELEQAQIQGMYARAGIVTINEARRFLGLAPLPDEFVYGQLPLPLALVLLEMGLVYQGAVTEDGVQSWDETMKKSVQMTAAQAEAQSAGKTSGENGGKPPAAGAGQRRTAAKSLLGSQREKIRDQVQEMTGMALRLKDFLKQSLGRDILSADVVFQNRDGDEIERIALGNLGDGEDSDD
jgi:PBSX family phage portal protein